MHRLPAVRITVTCEPWDRRAAAVTVRPGSPLGQFSQIALSEYPTAAAEACPAVTRALGAYNHYR
jgi:hypothetical protein